MPVSDSQNHTKWHIMTFNAIVTYSADIANLKYLVAILLPYRMTSMTVTL